LLLLGNEKDDRHLVEARLLLGTVSFTSHRTPCAVCTFPSDAALYEYGPTEDLRVSNYDAREAWPHYLYLDRMAYVSGNGERWVDGTDLPLLGFLLYDPRVLLTSLDDARFDREDDIDGNPVRIYRGTLNPDAYFSHLPWNLDPELAGAVRQNYRPIIDGAPVELWIDAGDYRVLRSSLRPVEDSHNANTDLPDEFYQREYTYGRDVTIPGSVASMPPEEADRLSRMGEGNTAPLLLAVEAYFRRNGVYPAALNPAALAGVFSGAWPVNAFTNEPMRDSTEAGDYTYVTKNNGLDYEYTLHGWENDQMFFDSARIDVPFQPRPAPP
jgi:hypothetical protein